MSLAKALQRIASELLAFGWDPRHIASDAEGNSCDPGDISVKGLSIGGAAIRAEISESSAVAAGEAIRTALYNRTGKESTIIVWECVAGRSLEEVLILLDEASRCGKKPKALKYNPVKGKKANDKSSRSANG